jgi:outer membrane receptor protein involved in Fe transport
LKKIITLFFVLFSICLSANGFNTSFLKNVKIKGKIIDARTREPIPYATVILKTETSNNFLGGVSDELGYFEIKKVPEGNYLIEIQFIGYEKLSLKVEVTSNSSDFDLGIIELEEVTENLQEVEIRAETSTIVQKIDRKVINIGKDLTSAGANAAEIMNNIQSVSVDNEGNISLRGNENVRILVDGRPTNISPSQLLQQIPSNSIKSIELITNPSAKYNPEGMSGIINIVLNKNTNLGFNGNINTGITKGLNTRFNGSLDLNYRAGKLNFFANYGLYDGKSETRGQANRVENNSDLGFNWIDDNASHLLKTGLDYYVNDKNILSFYTVQNIFNSDVTRSSTVDYLNGDFQNLDQLSVVELENNTQTYNLNYKHNFDEKGHHIEFEANISNTDGPETAVFQEMNNPANPILNYEDDIMNDRKNVTINLDYVNPLSEKSKLELGLETRTIDMENARITTQHGFVYDDEGNVIGTEPLEDTEYQYDREIYSAYATFSRKLEKWTMQLGARFESYVAEAILDQEKIFEDDYITLYPSAFVTYNPSDKNQFQMSYSRRVDRPGFTQVNPIRQWSTPQVTSVGNPSLRPQFTNSIEFNYTRKIKNGSLTFGTFVRVINDNINRAILEDPLDDNKVIITFANSDNNNAFGFEASANYNFTKWWDANMSFDIYNKIEKGVVGASELEVQNTAWNFRINNNFKVVKNFRLQWFTMYRGANQGLQFESKPMWKMDFGARLNLFQGKGTLSARYSDIFNTMFFAFDTKNPYQSSGQFRGESQAAYLGFNYRFGKGKNKGRSRKKRNGESRQGSGFM